MDPDDNGVDAEREGTPDPDTIHFCINFTAEPQALECAFALGDTLEDHAKVESWQMSYDTCSNCKNHVLLTGSVVSFFAGEDLVEIGHALAECSQAADGFLHGEVQAVSTSG